MKLTTAANICVVIACFITITAARKGGGYGPLFHDGMGYKDTYLVSKLIGGCQFRNCEDCPNSVLIRTVDYTYWSGYSYQKNITACAKGCGPIECMEDENGEKDCICPSTESSTCGFGSQCDSCNQAYVTKLFGWKTCCSDCSSNAVSFSGAESDDYRKQQVLCTCNSNTGSGSRVVTP